MNSELHLLIIWQRARYRQDDIIADIKTKFAILDCYEVEWTNRMVANNFSRFYGTKLPNRSFKERECGRGKFLLVLLRVDNPIYEKRLTSHGDDIVNVKMFDAKTLYRTWTGGGHKIHATNSPAETNHDLTLLLGVNYADYLGKAPSEWTGEIKTLKRDLSGAEGWNTLEELFYTLNSTLKYVVLRNYEYLPDKYKSVEHGDIDLLVEDLENAKFILNFKMVFKQSYRVHCECKIHQENVRFDLRYVGDNYYCKAWEHNILNNRILERSCFYVPEKNDYRFSLLYHALIQKQKLSDEYREKLSNLFDNIYIEDLNNFLYSNGYEFTKPIDKSVYYNTRNVNIPTVQKYLENNTPITDIKPFNVGSEVTPSGYSNFVGVLDGKKVFIKYGGAGDSCENEYIFSKKISENDNMHFLKPLLYKVDGKDKYVVFEFIEGIPLSEYMKTTNAEQKKQVGLQLLEIYDELQKMHIMHRDIRPDNFLVVNEKIILLDFQFAVDTNLRKELYIVKKDMNIAANLGSECRYKWYGWQDAYSFNLMMKMLCIDVSISSQEKTFYMSSYLRFLLFKLRKVASYIKRVYL